MYHPKKIRKYRLNCKNRSVQPAVVFKIYAHQLLGSHLSLLLNTKQRHSIYAWPIASLLQFGRSSKHEQNNKLTVTTLQQYAVGDGKGEYKRAFPEEIKTWCWRYHTPGKGLIPSNLFNFETWGSFRLPFPKVSSQFPFSMSNSALVCVYYFMSSPT